MKMGKIYDELLAKVLKRKDKGFDEDEYPKLLKKYRKKIKALLKAKIEAEEEKKEQEEAKRKAVLKKQRQEEIKRIEAFLGSDFGIVPPSVVSAVKGNRLEGKVGSVIPLPNEKDIYYMDRFTS